LSHTANDVHAGASDAYVFSRRMRMGR
jgi:hypothetical protein